MFLVHCSPRASGIPGATFGIPNPRGDPGIHGNRVGTPQGSIEVGDSRLKATGSQRRRVPGGLEAAGQAL